LQAKFQEQARMSPLPIVALVFRIATLALFGAIALAGIYAYVGTGTGWGG
jgi:hypothetical protein